MPIYTYKREDGTVFEVLQSIHDPVLTECPETGQPVKKIITKANLSFKGTGFYETDYKKRSGNTTDNDS
jgi:putative FmdB family regulatory protein